jgi:hypothetical protein
VDLRLKADRHRATAASAALIVLLTADIGVASDGADCPPNPEPGKCYEKVYSPALYEDRAEQVVDQPARTGSNTAPATFRIVVTRHKLRDASFTWQVVPCGAGRTPPRTGG